MTIRPALATDFTQITAIYKDEVLYRTATAEIEPPVETEMLARFKKVKDNGFPYLVYEEGGEIIGYAYANFFHARFGYRFTCEDSIYVAQKAQGKGVGLALLTALLDICEAKGLRQMMALIGGFENKGSIRLHEKCGFRLAGHAPSLYWKNNQWVDLIYMQKALGEGDKSDAPS